MPSNAATAFIRRDAPRLPVRQIARPRYAACRGREIFASIHVMNSYFLRPFVRRHQSAISRRSRLAFTLGGIARRLSAAAHARQKCLTIIITRRKQPATPPPNRKGRSRTLAGSIYIATPIFEQQKVDAGPPRHAETSIMRDDHLRDADARENIAGTYEDDIIVVDFRQRAPPT